jgi:hypothetical protein
MIARMVMPRDCGTPGLGIHGLDQPQVLTVAKAAINGPDSDHAQAPTEQPPPTCGIVMPISAIDDCPTTHWADVLEIVKEAAETAGFTGRLVSVADYSAVILGEIVENLYKDPIVVCDVSARNPNVMFELGMRLAFDMPTIVIKDDKTDYAFDASPIEHMGYPPDLRYQTINEFKRSLANKIKATHQKVAKGDYKSFLKHFGQFKVATLETKEVTGQQYIMEELRTLKSLMRELAVKAIHEPSITVLLEVTGVDSDEARKIADSVKKVLPRHETFFTKHTEHSVVIGIVPHPGTPPQAIADKAQYIIKRLQPNATVMASFAHN